MDGRANIDHLDRLGTLERQYMYGMQLYMFSGELSAFASFQTAVQTLKPLGQYGFITHHEESVSEILVAPFQFEHVLRPTTFIPLALLAGVAATGLDTGDGVDFADSVFIGGVSYNAGVGEEAFFRGYLMPYMRQSWNSDFWSNSAQAVVFGAAHYSSANPFPLAQALMGFYLGWLTQRNGWSVSQSAFLHAWWDVLALGSQIAHENGRNAVARPITLISLTF
jgi:membrane protease YdiL (CAAX protease family)